MADTVDGPDEHDEHDDEPDGLPPVMHAPGAAKKLLAAARREEALRLLADGVPQTVIAKRLGVTQPRIAAILKQELARSAALRIADADLIREQEGAKLDALEALALETLEAARMGWERSLQTRVTKTRMRRKGGPDGGHTEARIESEARAGDPRFLSVLMGAAGQRLRVAERRARLLGLDKPSKVALTDTDGDLLTRAMEGLSPAVLADLHRRAADKWAKSLDADDGHDADDAADALDPECSVSGKDPGGADDAPAETAPVARIEDAEELRAVLYREAVRECLRARRAGDKQAAETWARIMRMSSPEKHEKPGSEKPGKEA